MLPPLATWMPSRPGSSAFEFRERIAARPDHEDHLLAALALERVEDALRRRGEVGRVGRRVFLVHELGAGLRERRLERRHAVMAEGVILRERRDREPGLPTASAFAIASCEELRAVRKM